MLKPVIASDGYTYEKHVIEKWFTNNDTSPMTGIKINETLINNQFSKNIITYYLKKYPGHNPLLSALVRSPAPAAS